MQNSKLFMQATKDLKFESGYATLNIISLAALKQEFGPRATVEIISHIQAYVLGSFGFNVEVTITSTAPLIIVLEKV